MEPTDALEPAEAVEADAPDVGPEPETLPTRRFDRGFFIRGLILFGGAALILVGVFGSVTGRDQSNLPDEIEAIEPSLGDKVLNQANIVVDLIAGYGGRLVIDGVALPTASTQQSEPAAPGAAPTESSAVTTESSVVTTAPTSVDDLNSVRFDAGNNKLSYQPRPGADLERFDAGRHVVQVIYWKLTEGEANSFSYTWYFEVTA